MLRTCETGGRDGERDTIMADPRDGDPDDDAVMRARLKDLSGTLDSQRKASETRAGPAGLSAPNGMGQAMSLGFRVMSEFVAAVVVGGFIGWAIDRWLGTSPGFLIAFIALGTAAGFWNVYRIAMQPGGPGGTTRR
jgi:ATP synthase protein I